VSVGVWYVCGVYVCECLRLCVCGSFMCFVVSFTMCV